MGKSIDQVFAECIEAMESGEMTRQECLDLFPEYRDELEGLFQTVTHIQQNSLIEPSQAFTQSARTRLLSRLPEHRVTAAIPRPSRQAKRFPFHFPTLFHLRPAFSLAILLVLLFAMIGTGTVYASDNALPGDTLYPVKLSVENIQLSLASHQQQVDLGIAFMHERQNEINRLIQLGRVSDVVPAVSSLEGLSDHTVNEYTKVGSNPQPKTKAQGESLSQSIGNNINVLTQVATKVPPPAKVAIQHAIEMSQKNRDRVNQQLLGTPPVVPGVITGTETQTPTPTGTGTPEPTILDNQSLQKTPPGLEKKETPPPGLEKKDSPVPSNPGVVPKSFSPQETETAPPSPPGIEIATTIYHEAHPTPSNHPGKP